MLVVSDASPINILIRIGNVEILQSLFTTVILPTAVADELTRPGTPDVVRNWISSRPSWLRIQTPTIQSDPSEIRHRGEREAINLALELKADLLLVDEPRPRRAATSLGIPVIGQSESSSAPRPKT